MSAINTRVLAGVSVPDTPIITKAIEYARKHNDDIAYNHVMRSWLFGTFIADQIPDLKTRDKEIHAVAAILHDLGWSKTPGIISSDKRFEVDSANAARDFLLREGVASEWDNQRLRLVWDAIALHTTHSIALHKEIEVRSCVFGISADFIGPEHAPGGVLTRDIWTSVVSEFPRSGFKEGVREVLCGFCRTKPSTTYDNFVGEMGDKFVPGYSRDGQSLVKILLDMKE